MLVEHVFCNVTLHTAILRDGYVSAHASYMCYESRPFGVASTSRWERLGVPPGRENQTEEKNECRAEAQIEAATAAVFLDL